MLNHQIFFSEVACTIFSQAAAVLFLLLAVSSTCTDIPYKFLNTSKLVRTLSVVSVVVATPMSTTYYLTNAHRKTKTNECFLPSLARQSPHKAFYWSYIRASPGVDRVLKQYFSGDSSVIGLAGTPSTVSPISRNDHRTGA